MKTKAVIYHKRVYSKSRNTIFHLEVALPGGSVFFELSGKKTNRTSFIKYIIKKPNKAGGRKMGFSKMLELLQEKNKG